MLTIKSADKQDGGVYRLSLENDLGQDSCNLEFTVNGQFLRIYLQSRCIYLCIYNKVFFYALLQCFYTFIIYD